MKKIFILITFITSIFANELDKLYDEAEFLEASGKYKAAMLIYKEIAKKEKNINRVYIDEEERKKIDTINKIIDPIEDRETYETIEQIVASKFNLYPHHENYFLPFSYDTEKREGRNQTEAKFQLSVKKPIINNLFGLNETINFGYTHTSWWQIYEESAPFRETNYKPEVFVTIPYGKSGENSLKALSFGLLHESNGRSEPESRSWNRLYLEGYFQAGNLFVVPRVWYRIPENEEDDDNPDLQDYLGYGDLTLVYPYKKHTFKLLLRNNFDFSENRGFAELDWSFPLFGSKNTFGYLQFSTGYGDSLIDYDEEINRVSFGITLSR